MNSLTKKKPRADKTHPSGDATRGGAHAHASRNSGAPDAVNEAASHKPPLHQVNVGLGVLDQSQDELNQSVAHSLPSTTNRNFKHALQQSILIQVTKNNSILAYGLARPGLG